MDKSTSKLFPKWLKDGSSLKNLPPIYYGILAQVQIQPNFSTDASNNIRDSGNSSLATKLNQKDFLDKYTDTERVHQLLLTSRLTNETMGHIWAFCNRSFPGKLTNRELCLALALIAMFQSKENNKQAKNNQDPFELIKSVSKPPVPKLYSRVTSGQTITTVNHDLTDLLINIDTDNEKINKDDDEKISKKLELRFNVNDNLLEIDCDIFAENLSRICEVWLTLLESMYLLFKRTFDIFNVEHSRDGSLEALRSIEGRKFSLSLSIAYPIAYKIATKIELIYERFKDELLGSSKLYFNVTRDILISINEYWAVLMNLFHESGLTYVLELIMDGLNCIDKKFMLRSKTVDELRDELFSKYRSDYCMICQSNKYLPALDKMPSIDFEIDLSDLFNDSPLISQDSQYFYHSKCANFWLKQTNSAHLPFKAKNDIMNILSPQTSLSPSG